MGRMKLDSDSGTFSYNSEHGTEIDVRKKEFLDDLNNGENIIIAHGIFSPEEVGSDAYVRLIKPLDGGTFLKVYGCSFIYKGNSPRELVYGLLMPKYLFSGFLRDIVGRSLVYTFAVIIRFFFQRKK